MLGITCAVLMATAAPFRPVSLREPAQVAPVGGSGDSWAPVITPDGRYVLFASLANNLVSTSSGNGLPGTLAPRLNVFLRDRTNGTTFLVSVSIAGDGGGNGDSLPTGISSNGRFALFESSANNLVPGDTNGVVDVFVRDVVSNVTILVSVSTNGGFANGVSRGSTITPDGRYVAFVSAANNLAPGDTNGVPDVFVRDLQDKVTTLVSVGVPNANPYSLVSSESPDITDDGRYVAFYTLGTNVGLGSIRMGEIYMRDVVAGTTTWVSGSARALLGLSNVFCFNHVLAQKGEYVAFEACSNPPPASAYAHGAIMRYNAGTGLTDLIHTNAYVSQDNAQDISTLDMTPDGRFVVFVANTNGVPGTTCVLMWDGQTGLTTLVSADLSGRASTNATCDSPSLDTSGRFVAFLSSATNLVTNSVSPGYHLYVRDVQAGMTTLVDADTNGIGTAVSPSTVPRLNGDATIVAFESPDASLVANDRNRDYDVFAHDLTGGLNDLVSAHDPALPSATPNGASAITPSSVSADGRFVAFTSEADNLVPSGGNGFRNVFVRDLFLGSTLLASVATNGSAADGICSEPALSVDGRYLAFTSGADNLVPNDFNRVQDVFLRDLQSGTTALVSVNPSGNGPGNAPSEFPSISADGRFVLFWSKATNLTAAMLPVGTENLFLRDMQALTTYALTRGGVSSASMTRDGRLVAYTDTAAATAGNIYNWDSQAGARIDTNSLGLAIGALSLSPDGSKIVCFAGASPPGLYVLDRIARTHALLSSGYPIGGRLGLRFSSNGRWLVFAAAPVLAGTNQVYLYDFQTQSKRLVSAAFGSPSVGANGVSDWPDISADGRFVAYRSFASNLLPSPVSNGAPNLHVYDRLSDTSSLLSASRLTGGVGDNRSLAPAFSADGRTLVFQSWASDLLPLDFNHWDDVFALAFLYVSIVPGSGPGQGPTLTWPARPGENYQVQYKNSLADPVWQPVAGAITIDGNQAHLTDTGSTAGERFYRVVAF